MANYNGSGEPGDGMYRYQLVALPKAELKGALAEELRMFSHSYHGDRETDPEPCVVVSEFMAREEMEETIIRYLQRITGEQESFDITFNNYSGTPMHTVYIRILDHRPFQALAAQLQPIDGYVRSNDCPPVKFMLQPNIPISKKLSGRAYEQAIAEYARRDFHGSFEVTELMLVRDGTGYGNSIRRAVLRLQPARTGLSSN